MAERTDLLETCEEYIEIIKIIEESGADYAMEMYRIKIHKALCSIIGKEHEATKAITDHIDKLDYNPRKLAEALRAL